MFIIAKITHVYVQQICAICAQWVANPFYLLKINIYLGTNIRFCESCFNTKWLEYSGYEPTTNFPAVVQQNYLLLPFTMALSYICMNCNATGPQLSLIVFADGRCGQNSYCKYCLTYDIERILHSYSPNRKLLKMLTYRGYYAPISILDLSEQEAIKKENKHVSEMIGEHLPIDLCGIVIDYYWFN